MINPYLYTVIKEEKRHLFVSQSPHAIIQLVADYFKLIPEQLCQRTRLTKIREPRQIAMHLIRENTHLTFMEIAELFNLDKATVMHANKRIENLISIDKLISNDVSAIRIKLKG